MLLERTTCIGENLEQRLVLDPKSVEIRPEAAFAPWLRSPRLITLCLLFTISDERRSVPLQRAIELVSVEQRVIREGVFPEALMRKVSENV